MLYWTISIKFPPPFVTLAANSIEQWATFWKQNGRGNLGWKKKTNSVFDYWPNCLLFISADASSISVVNLTNFAFINCCSHWQSWMKRNKFRALWAQLLRARGATEAIVCSQRTTPLSYFMQHESDWIEHILPVSRRAISAMSVIGRL